MFITILEVNGQKYNGNRKEVRKRIFIPDFFKNEEQFDRWFEEAFKKYSKYHLREKNTPIIQEFENLKLKLKFS